MDETLSREPLRAPTARDALACFVLAAAFCAASYFAFGHIGLQLADEGYLWYGVLRTVAGEVPLRDFQSYEPGRYYWCAALAPLVGSGILGVRAALCVFQALGLTAGLLVARRCVRGSAGLVLWALILGVWMFPRHKQFEPSLAMMAVWVVVRLIERPTARRHFEAGLFAGLAGWIGRNHAGYVVLATAAVLVLLAWKERVPGGLRRSGAWVLGGIVGHAPMWFMLLFVPGFAAAFLDSMRVVLSEGANLPLPYPFPWRTDWSQFGGLELVCEAALSAAFLLPFLVVPLGIARVLRRASGALAPLAVTLAAAAVGLVYVHHVSVRSDAPHLAQSIGPLLLLSLALSAARPALWQRVAAQSFLAVLTALAVWTAHPLLQRLRPWQAAEPLLEHDTAGEKLQLLTSQANYLTIVEQLVARNVPADETLFIAPNRPTLYCVLDKVAPSWWIYFFWEASEEEQRAQARELDERGVNWAFVVDPSRLRETHAVLWQHLASSFERVPTPALNPTDYFMRRRR